ncbi:MAG: hypothetical protein IJN25_09865 [Clostridia bacterium]|nr:hypothetical protein [Clostridia bacterium]
MSEYVTQKMVSELETKIKDSDSICSKDDCVKTEHQKADVSVPIQLKPKATIGDIVMECCDEPEVKCHEDKHKNVCEVIVTQKVCIKIPIRYQISACAGESFIKFDCCEK